MISFENIQVGKLYLMNSFDYDKGIYYNKEIVIILRKYMDENYDCQEVVDYLLGAEEYSVYFTYGEFAEIKT